MATVAETLEGLAVRCGSAAGPDRVLDWAIAEALGLVPEHSVIEIGWDHSWYRHPGDFYLARCPGSDQHAGVEMWSSAKVTASLDAAMTLVPEGCGWIAGWGQVLPDEPMGGAQITRNARFIGYDENYDTIALAEAATPALALCAAALRAAAAKARES